MLDGKYVVAKYCQWDVYPKGQGKIALEFLRDKFNREKFVKNLKKVRPITDKKLNKYWVECGNDSKSNFVSSEVGTKFLAKYPNLHRDMGADILAFIQNHTERKNIELQDDLSFASNSLFCEWCWVVDLDQVNKLPDNETFFKTFELLENANEA